MLMTGLSGNEIYCLSLKGFSPGEIAVGNSVQSLGLLGGIGSSLRTLAGGEIQNLTQLISEGRHAAISRMEQEARNHGAVGITLDRAQRFVQEAKVALLVFPDSPIRRALADVADYTVQRLR